MLPYSILRARKYSALCIVARHYKTVLHNTGKCIIMYKRINGYLPNYLNEHLILNNKRHSRNTRYSSINAVCPKYRKETEGGRSFAVSATRLWNSIPIEIRKLDSIACFKKYMFAKSFKEQQCLHHFII